MPLLLDLSGFPQLQASGDTLRSQLHTCVLVEQPLVVHALPAWLHCRLPQRNLFRDVAVPVACQATLLHAMAICRGTQQEVANVG